MITDLSLPRLFWKKATHDSTAAVEEQDLSRRLAEGDLTAIGEAYDRHAPALYRVLYAILGSSQDAEDALQEVFVRLAGGRNGRIRDLKAYLHTAARHEAYGILRRRRREQIVELQPLETMEANETVQADFQAFAERSDLIELLQHLPPEQREIIALKVFEELTFAQIAAIVQASPNTVASRYRYGIERLRTWCLAATQDVEGGNEHGA